MVKTVALESIAEHPEIAPLASSRLFVSVIEASTQVRTRARRSARTDVTRQAIPLRMNPVPTRHCYVGSASCRLTVFLGGPDKGAIQGQCQTTKK